MDLPYAIIDVFQKTVFVVRMFWLFFPDYSYFICWLFGLEAKHFPTGYFRTVLKIGIFYYSYLTFDCIAYFLVCPIYILGWANMQNSFRFWKFCFNVHLLSDECCKFVVVLKQLRCKAFTTGVLTFDKYTCFSLDYTFDLKIILFFGNFQFLESLILKITERCDY